VGDFYFNLQSTGAFMLKTQNLKSMVNTHYHYEPAYQASIGQRPYRKLSPKREVRVHVSNRVRKGPLESKG